MRQKLIALLAIFGLTLTALLAPAPMASAQDGGSLIIGVSNCPDGYDGDDYAADCASPAAGVDFNIGTPHTGNTETTTSRGDGLATFSLTPYDLDPTGPDPVSVGEPATQTSDYAVFCTKNDGEPLDFATDVIDFEPGGPLLGISFEFETGDDIACEWYRIRQPMPGDGNDDDGQVDELPNTGVGAATTANAGRFDGLPHLTILLTLTAGAAYALRRRVAV